VHLLFANSCEYENNLNDKDALLSFISHAVVLRPLGSKSEETKYTPYCWGMFSMQGPLRKNVSTAIPDFQLRLRESFSTYVYIPQNFHFASLRKSEISLQKFLRNGPGFQ
jgi:hypothetical protein